MSLDDLLRRRKSSISGRFSADITLFFMNGPLALYVKIEETRFQEKAIGEFHAVETAFDRSGQDPFYIRSCGNRRPVHVYQPYAGAAAGDYRAGGHRQDDVAGQGQSSAFAYRNAERSRPGAGREPAFQRL